MIMSNVKPGINLGIFGIKGMFRWPGMAMSLVAKLNFRVSTKRSALTVRAIDLTAFQPSNSASTSDERSAVKVS